MQFVNRAGGGVVKDTDLRTSRASWIFDRRTDLFVAFLWIPLFLAAHRAVAGQGLFGHPDLATIVDIALLVSFMHQPLTLGLVYGDSRQFALRARVFTVAPVIAVVVAFIGVHYAIWLAVPIAAIWNTVHTLQQRYGLCRIYSRKAGYGSPLLDRAVLYTWMGAALLLVAANPATTRLLQRVELGQTNDEAVRVLTEARPYALALLLPVLLAAAFTTVAIVRQEAHAPFPNRGKWIYQASSLALIAAIAVDPAAGFVAYVGSHALEYVVVVYRGARTRTADPEGRETVLGHVAATRAGRCAYVVGVMALAALAHARLSGDSYLTVLYVVGALHFLYDGMIWKLRRPAVAAAFAIPV